MSSSDENNELEMTNLVIQQGNSNQQRPNVNLLTHTNEMKNMVKLKMK